MFKHLLIGYDGSEHGRRALLQGIELAQLAGAALTIVTAFPKTPDYLGSPQYDDLVGRLSNKAHEIAESAAKLAREQGVAEVRVEVLEGGPAEGILSVAETRQCDGIVVGSRGLDGLSGLLLGSVSDRLAHLSKVPLLIVK